MPEESCIQNQSRLINSENISEGKTKKFEREKLYSIELFAAYIFQASK